MSNVENGTESATSFLKKRPEMVVAPHLEQTLRVPEEAFAFSFQVIPALDYQVQASTDLCNWSILESNCAKSDRIEYKDLQAPKFPFRFYRVAAKGIVSCNVVGYASVSLPPGFSMVSNPFIAASNAVSTLFAAMPDGTTLSKFDTSLFRLTENALRNGKWNNPNETLLPGEGAIIFNPSNKIQVIDFAGEVMQGNLCRPIPAGFSICSSQLPQPGRLYPNLEFPISSGDVIHLFDRKQQKYLIYSYPSKEWDQNPPALTVGESFWVGKVAPCNWVRTFGA